MELAGKVALVTGAGTGMGRAIALTLAREGCKVVAVGRREDKLNETIALFRESSSAGAAGTIHAKACDVSSHEQVAKLVADVEAQLGPIELLVNNAGANIRQRTLEVLSVADFEHLIRINLVGAFNVVHAVLPGMRRRKEGLMIHVSSIAGVRPSSLGGAAYTASKFGLNGLSGVIALEDGKHGVRSTVICPGEVNTPILDDRPVPVSAERRAVMLQPEDVAAAVLFVAQLPARAHVPELIIKPTNQEFA